MATLDGREPDLLDREPVLREIDALVREAAVRGARAIVRVVGPPGIGKTAVLQTVMRSFSGRARFAAAEPAGRMSQGSVARLLLNRGAGASRTVRTLRSELRSLVAESDLIVLDDIQWIDEFSVSEMLAAAGAGAQLTFVLGDRRPHAPEWPAHETIELAPLRHSSALELVRRTYPAVSPAVAAEVAGAAGGVPFAVLLLALDAAARDVSDAGDAALSVATVMARRLGRLRVVARDVVDLISLAEPPVPLRVIARALALPRDEVAAVVTELADVVTLDGSIVAFRHDVLATAVAALVSNQAAAYARLLYGYEEEPSSLAAIVRSALGCGRQERAASAALELARALARDGSLGSALRYAELAMNNARRPLPVDYAVEYAVILQMLSRDEEAAGFLRQAIRTAIEAGNAPAAAELVAAFFNPAVTLERFTELEVLCARVEKLTASDDVRARLRGVRLASLAYAGRFDEYLRLSATIKEPSWIDARAAAFVHALRGDFTRSASAADAYAAGLGLRHARQQTADRIFDAIVAFFYHGTPALDVLEALPATDTRHGSEQALRVLRRICEGRWDEARHLLSADEADVDQPERILEVRLLLAALSPLRAVDARATRDVRSMIKQRRIRHAAAFSRWYLMASGDECPADIEAFARETLEIAPVPDAFIPSALSTAQLRDRFGSARCRAAVEQYPVFDTPWHRAHHALALGVVGSSNEHFRTARTAFEELNCPAFATIAGIALPLPRARDLAAARALGLAPPAARATVVLTRRERAVAEHTARGASNQEVAEALSISVRTVETHLTKIYYKLGVSSRGAMTALMHDELL